MMERKLLAILAIAAIAVAAATVIVATSHTGEKVEIIYDLNDDLTAGVEDVTGDPVRLTIPSQTVSDGKTYTVTHIEYGALDKCGKMEYLDLPSSLMYIEDGVLDSRYSLKGIDVAEGNEFYSSVDGVLFDAYKKLLVKYPASKTGESYTVPESAWVIMDMAFCGASKLKDVVLHDGIYSFGNFTFKDCTSLRSVTIPESLSTIGLGSFNGCSSLESIDVSTKNKHYESEDGILYQIGGYRLLQYPIGSSAAVFELPEMVMEISDGAFAECTKLKEITLNGNLIWIGAKAFEGCTSLTTVHNNSCLPVIAGSDMCGSVAKYASEVDGTVGSYVDDDGFAYSYNMKSGIAQITGYRGEAKDLSIEADVDIEEDKYEINSIGMIAFLGTDVEKVSLPSTLVSIAATAFYGCGSLTDFAAGGLAYIGISAFSGCSSLARVDLDMSISFVDDSAFEDISTIKRIEFDSGLMYVGDDAFSGLEFFDGETEVIPVAEELSGTIWTGSGDGKVYCSRSQSTAVRTRFPLPSKVCPAS